jgi:signal transduction histidine kinase
MNEGNKKRVDRVIHDLRNSLGSIILNLEIVADPAYSSGIALEAATDALDEARRLKEAVTNLGSAMEVTP